MTQLYRSKPEYEMEPLASRTVFFPSLLLTLRLNIDFEDCLSGGSYSPVIPAIRILSEPEIQPYTV